MVPSPFDTVPPESVATTKQVLPAPGPHAPPHPDPGAIPHAAAAPHRSCGSSRASACSRVRSSGGTSFEGHPLLEGTPAPGDLTAWPWIDFDPPALDRLLERLFRDTGRRAAFGRRRCRTGFVARRAAEDLEPFRLLERTLRDSAIDRHATQAG